MNAPSVVEVTFPVTLEREGEFTWPFRGTGDIEVTRELRAVVTFTGVYDEPTVERLEKAEWEALDADEQIGAEEQAIEYAWQKLQRRMGEAS